MNSWEKSNRKPFGGRQITLPEIPTHAHTHQHETEVPVFPIHSRQQLFFTFEIDAPTEKWHLILNRVTSMCEARHLLLELLAVGS